MIRYHWHWVLTIAFVPLAIGASSNAGTPTAESDRALEAKFSEIAQRLDSRKVVMRQAESEVLALAREYTSPKQKARIYERLVRWYASAGTRNNAAKIAQYCEEALKYPQTVTMEIRLQLMWSTAAWDIGQGTVLEKANPHWRPAMQHLLKAYAIVVANQTAKEPAPVPGIPIGCMDDPKDVAALAKANKEAFEAASKVTLQNELIEQRREMTKGIVSLFPSGPEGAAQFREIAAGILTDQAALDELADAIASPRPASTNTTQPATQPALW